MRMLRLALVALLALLPAGAWAQFDHSHRAWSELLARHVVVQDGGKASRVRYAGFEADRDALQRYLGALAAVGQAEYEGWSKPERLAFLINAYNAFTVELILRHYPGIESIRDVGSLFTKPWRMRFFTLLGTERHLDDIEHGLIRAPGAFGEPRIHFAVNCASVGCPMLREEAYVASRLDAQLEDQTRRFLADRSRNRYDPQRGALAVSRIFDWYAADFESGLRGIESRGEFFAPYASLLADAEPHRRAIAAARVPIRFLEYDWSLNDAGN